MTKVIEVRKFDFRAEDVTVFENGIIRVFAPCKPHTHAEFGGHLVVQTKKFRSVCTEFTPEESRHAWAAVQACTECIVTVCGAVRTNNQDNGNWFFLLPENEQVGKTPRCHIHIYGRSPREDWYTGPGRQKWGKSLDFPLPDEPGLDQGTVWMNYVQPYSDGQIELLQKKLPALFALYLAELTTT